MKLKPVTPKRSLMDAVLSLTGNELKTYLYLKETADSDGVVDFKMRGFCKQSGICNTTAKNCAYSLAEKGWVEILRQSCKSTGKETVGKTTMLVRVL